MSNIAGKRSKADNFYEVASQGLQIALWVTTLRERNKVSILQCRCHYSAHRKGVLPLISGLSGLASSRASRISPLSLVNSRQRGGAVFGPDYLTYRGRTLPT